MTNVESDGFCEPLVKKFNSGDFSYTIDDRGFVRFSGSRFCKICNREHLSNGALVKYKTNEIIYICLAENKSERVITGNGSPQQMSLLESVMCDQRIAVELTNATIKQNRRFFELEWTDSLENQNIVIRSALGTGKTQWVVDTLKHFRNVVYISNRRTLSNAICERLKFISYEDVSGDIDLQIYSRIVVQIDSLHRIKNLDDADLIIYDEFCSILSHICGNTERNEQKQVNFLDSFKSKATRVFMDGFICDSDVKLIKRLSNTFVHTFSFHNTFQPFTTNTIIVKPYWHTKNHLVVDDILQKLNVGLRLMVSVTSANLAQFIATEIQEKSKNQIKLKLYTGEDYRLVEGGISHAQQKKHDFKNVEKAWKDMDLVIHTSTLQAGVDYSVCIADTFDTFVHVYTGMSNTADQFVQSTLRCRNWKNKEHIMYIRQGSEHGDYMLTPNQTFKQLNKLYSKTNMMHNRLTD